MTSRSIFLIASAFATMTPVAVAAQETVDSTVTTRGGEEEQFPWGLLGLIGLAGLIPRKQKEVHTERTAARS